MSIKIELEFSDKDIADLLCSAIEGGFGNTWVKVIDYTFRGESRAKPWGDDYTPGYIAAPFTKGACLIVRIQDDCVGAPTRRQIDAPKIQDEYRVTRSNLAKGLQVMAATYPHHFAAFIDEKADAVTGDAFLQCCVFGEIVFG